MLPLAPADIPHLAPHSSAASLAYGVQAPARGAGGAAPHPPALVCVADVRLPHVATDLLVTLNVPVADAPDEAAALGVLRAVLRSVRVVDWRLFGASQAASA